MKVLVDRGALVDTQSKGGHHAYTLPEGGQVSGQVSKTCPEPASAMPRKGFPEAGLANLPVLEIPGEAGLGQPPEDAGDAWEPEP